MRGEARPFGDDELAFTLKVMGAEVCISVTTLIGSEHTELIRLPTFDLEQLAGRLLTRFEAYCKDRSPVSLRGLADEGRKVFGNLVNRSVSDEKRRFLKKIISTDEILDFSHAIYVFSPKTLHFPFGLLFLGDRQSVNESPETLAKLFLGARAIVVNVIDVGHPILSRRSERQFPANHIIHCIRSCLSGIEIEKKALAAAHFVIHEAHTKEQFISEWNRNCARVGLVHFSAEHAYSDVSQSFEIYFDDPQDPLLISDLYEQLEDSDTQPLVFLNCCETGFFRSDMSESFVSAFARICGGLIATLVKVDSEMAAEFAARFYKRVFGGDCLSEAIVFAKLDLVELGDATGLCFEVWNINHRLTRLKGGV